MIRIIQFLLTAGFFCCLMSVNAQYRDSVVFAAMTDEMERNLNELKEEDKGTPFFISYSCDLSEANAISASLGSIYYASTYPYGATGVRVMVGDYDFNDESLNASSNDFTYNSYTQPQVPIKEDYWGLRKIFWQATDRTYRSAAETFEDHKKLLEKEDLSIEDTPHRSFAQVEIVKDESDDDFLEVDRLEWEKRLEIYSALFSSYDDLDGSGCSFNTISTKHYFITSEGTRIKTVKNLVELSLYANMLAENGEQMIQSREYLVNSTSELPGIETVKSDIADIRNQLLERRSAVKFDDEYEGPVLLVGQAVSSFLNTSLGGYLRANTTVKNPTDEYGYTYKSKSIEDEIGEKYTNELVSISIDPTIKTFNEKTLLGSYEYDSEGVKPIGRIDQIEYGILRKLRCSRTTSKETHMPTGNSIGPGVIISDVDKTIAYSKMKKKLIKMAKSDKLDYAVIIRSQPTSGNVSIRKVYQVDLKTGSETLLDGAVINGLDRAGIDELVAGSEEKVAYNISNNYSGDIVSCIAPKAVFINNVKLSAETMSFKAEPSLVENPLIDGSN